VIFWTVKEDFVVISQNFVAYAELMLDRISCTVTPGFTICGKHFSTEFKENQTCI